MKSFKQYTESNEKFERRPPGTYRDLQGRPHRLNGPAYISPNQVTQIWYRHGLKHRIDGPAVIHMYSDMANEYWIAGKRVELEQFKQLVAMFPNEQEREFAVTALDV